MASLYKAVAGTVVKDSISSPSFLSVDGLDSMLNGGKMMTSSIRIERGQDYAIVKTLSNAFYAYAFGEMPGKIMVGGIMFLVNCSSPGSTSGVVRQINDYYEQNCIYLRSNPVRITVDGAVFSTYLTNLSVAADQNQFNYASFNLGFAVIPKNA